jgi:ribonucleoside-triphosphate reductase
MPKQIIKRDQTVVPFRKEKIVLAIFKAASSVGGTDFSLSETLAEEVVRMADQKYPNGIAEVEGIQDIVEKVLIEKWSCEDGQGLHPISRKTTCFAGSQCIDRRNH